MCNQVKARIFGVPLREEEKKRGWLFLLVLYTHISRHTVKPERKPYSYGLYEDKEYHK
jgi:hypothetical protein